MKKLSLVSYSSTTRNIQGESSGITGDATLASIYFNAKQKIIESGIDEY